MKCFYHNDLDGRCAGSIVAQFTQNYNQEDYFEVDYIKLLPIDKIKEDETVYFVDYSFTEDTIYQLQSILEKTPNIIWIDHHTSSLNLIKEYPELNQIKGFRQDKISGAALTYMYLYNCDFDSIPFYIKYVSDYDCWLYKFDPNTTYFKIGMDMVKYNALGSIWKILYNENAFDYSDELTNIINNGKAIKTYIDQDNTQHRNSWSYESEIDGIKCLVINRKSNSWIFGEKVNEYPITMVWIFNGEKYNYSIYSIDPNVDCSKVAEKFGGGGHKGAAGFSSNELLFKKK